MIKTHSNRNEISPKYCHVGNFCIGHSESLENYPECLARDKFSCYSESLCSLL